MDRTATSASEIGIAFQKVGSTADALKIPFEKVASYIATISSVTREAPETVGSAVKAILSRVESVKSKGYDSEDGTTINQVSKALDTANIKLVAANGQFRDFSTVLDELGAKWNSIDDKTQRYIATTVAGTYQQSRFLALMSNYGRVLDLNSQALNAAGTTQSKYNIYLEGTQAHIDRLKNAMEGVWSNSFSSKTIQTIIDSLTSLVSGISFITDKFGIITPLIFAASAALLLFNTRIQTLAATGWAATFTTIINGIKGTATALTTLNFAALSARISVIALQTTLSLGLSLAITAVVSGLTALFNKYQEQEAQQKSFADQQKSIADNWNNQKDSISKLLAEYNSLNDVRNRTQEQDQKYLDVTNQLSKLMPNLVASIDDTGQAHLKSAEAMAKELDYAQKLATVDSKKNVGNATDDFTTMLKQRVDAEKDLADTKKRLVDGQTISRDAMAHNSAVIKLTDSQIANLEMKALGFEQKISVASDDLKGKIGSLASTLLSLSGVKIDDNLSQQFQKLIQSMDISKISKPEEFTALASKIGSSMAQLKSVASDENSTKRSIDAAKQSFESLLSSFGASPAQAQLVINSMMGIKDAVRSTVTSEVDLDALQKKLVDIFGKTEQAVAPLNDAIDKLKQGHQLTSGEITSLLKKYPDLFSAFKTENGHLVINTQALETKRQAEIDGMQTSLDAETKIVSAQEQALLAKLKMYGVEIDAINSVADAKNATASIRDADPNASEIDKYGAEYAASQLSPQLEAIGKAKESIKALQDAAKENFSFKDTLNTPKPQSEPTPFDQTENFKNNPFQRAMKDLEGELKASESIMTRYKDTSQEYRDELQKQADIHTKQRDLQSSEADRIRAEDVALQHRLDTEKLSIAERNKVLKQLEDNKNTLSDLSMKWWDYELAVSEVNKKITDSTTKVNEEIGKQRDELDKAAEKAADKFVAEYKKGVNALIDAEDTRHKNEMDNLDEKKKKFDESIDDALKAMDRLDATQSFNDDFTEKEKEKATIVDKIKKLDLAGDLQAKEEKAKLQTDLDKLNKDIAKMSRDRNRQVVKDGLTDLKDAKSKEIEASKTAEDKKYNDAKKTLEARLNDETLFLNLKEDLMNGDASKIQSLYSNLATELNKNSESIGKSITENLINNLKLAATTIKEVQSQVSNGGGLEDWQVKLQRAANNDEYAKSEITRAKDVYNSSTLGGNSSAADAAHKWADQIRAVNPRVASDPLFSAETGGMTPSFSGARFLLAHEKEIILNKFDSANILKAVDITRNFMSNIKMPDFSNIIGKSSATTTGGSTIQVMGNLINVDKMDANTNIENLTERLINKMESLTGSRLRTN